MFHFRPNRRRQAQIQVANLHLHYINLLLDFNIYKMYNNFMDMSDYLNLDPIEDVYIDSYKFYCKIHQTKQTMSAQYQSGGFTKKGEYLEVVENILKPIEPIDTLNSARPEGEMVMICRKIQNLVNSGTVIVIYFNKIYAIDKDLFSKLQTLKK